MKLETLEDVIEQRLGDAYDYADGEDGDKAFKEAMTAIDRYIALKKIENADKERELNLQLEEEKYRSNLKLEEEKYRSNLKLEEDKFEHSKEEQKKRWITELAIGVGVPVVLFIGDCLFKNHYMKSVCNFEKDYTFTTTPGKGISGLFRFKK